MTSGGLQVIGEGTLTTYTRGERNRSGSLASQWTTLGWATRIVPRPTLSDKSERANGEVSEVAAQRLEVVGSRGVGEGAS